VKTVDMIQYMHWIRQVVSDIFTVWAVTRKYHSVQKQAK